MQALELAQANGIILLQLPGHTTHRLQPLDIGVFGPMQTFYNQVLDQWMTNHAGQCITQYDVAALITTAYYKAASVSNAAKSFEASGCWPVNRFVFSEADFVASDLLNKPHTPEQSNEIDVASDMPTEVVTLEGTNIEADFMANNLNKLQILPENSENSVLDNELQTSSICNISNNSCLKVPIPDLSPIPKVTNRKRGAQKATVLTTETYINTLREKKKATLKGKSKVKKTKVEKKIIVNNASTSSSTDIVVKVNEDDWFCNLCATIRLENMIQCILCKTWVHEACAGVLKKDKIYLCPKCS